MRHPAAAKLQGQKIDEQVPGAEGGESLTEKRQPGNHEKKSKYQERIAIVCPATVLGHIGWYYMLNVCVPDQFIC